MGAWGRPYTLAADSFFCTAFDTFPTFVAARYAGEVRYRLQDGTIQGGAPASWSSEPRWGTGIVPGAGGGVGANCVFLRFFNIHTFNASCRPHRVQYY